MGCLLDRLSIIVKNLCYNKDDRRGVAIVGFTFERLSFHIKFLGETLIRSIKVILYINYVIIICVNNSNAVININYGRLQDLILLFKIPMGTRKNFFEINRQFGSTPSKR